MAKSASNGMIRLETFINSWNSDFPDHQLTVEDMKKPIPVMRAIFTMFERLGLDNEKILDPSMEKDKNSNVVYYQDLLPVIQITRVINDMVQSVNVSVNYFLQPSASTLHSVLVLLYNMLLFHEQRLAEIAPYEEELFSVTNMVKTMQEKVNMLVDLLNQQSKEKATRSERMKEMTEKLKLLEEDLKAEEEVRDQYQNELEAIIKENNALDVMLDQKRSINDGLIADRDRKKALRVYDAEDVKNQAEQAAQRVKEAEQKLFSLGEVMAQKENTLKILQTIKPNLDTANNLLHEIEKLKECEHDLDGDSKDGKLEMLSSELTDLKMQESELKARHEEVSKKRQEAQAKRQQEKILLENQMREATELDNKRQEFIVNATQRTEEIKEQTKKYAEEKKRGIETVQEIKNYYEKTINDWNNALNNLIAQVLTDIKVAHKELDNFRTD